MTRKTKLILKNDSRQSFYAFGDPEPVENDRLLDYLGVFPDAFSEFYIPPVSFAGLGKLRHACGHHGSCLVFRRNMSVRAFVKGPCSLADFMAAVTDLLTFGNVFFEVEKNSFGQPVGLSHIPAVNMRVLYPAGRGFRQLLPDGKYLDFAPDELVQLKEYDTNQQVYGMPDWLGGMQSILLNQDATLFRRKYFKNGCHLGYIFYTNDPKMNADQEQVIKRKLEDGKGAGNFRTMFVSIPNGGEKAIQIIPIGDISQRDEFANIKNISAADVREAHRVPPVLMGVAPTGTGSMGDPVKTEQVYTSTEVAALARTFESLNNLLPAKIRFKFNTEVKDESSNNQ
ncbi:MAG: phage portal protein [Victivallaceae bacterium]|nr:phage portal protein [Victivallaceae bacterium]